MENTTNNPNGGFTEPVKQHQPQPNGKESGTEPDFPEVVDWKSPKATIYRQRHRGKFRYEVRHSDAEGLMQLAVSTGRRVIVAPIAATPATSRD